MSSNKLQRERQLSYHDYNYKGRNLNHPNQIKTILDDMNLNEINKYDPRAYENYKRNIIKQDELHTKIDNYSSSVLLKERNLLKNQNNLYNLAILNKYNNEMAKMNIRNKTLNRNSNNYNRNNNYNDINHLSNKPENNYIDQKIKNVDNYNNSENQTKKNNNNKAGILNTNPDPIDNMLNDPHIFQDNYTEKYKINISESSNPSIIIDNNNNYNNEINVSQQREIIKNYIKRSSSLHNNKKWENTPIIIDFKEKRNHQILEQLEKQNEILANFYANIENKQKTNEVNYEQEYETLEKDYQLKNELGKLKNEVFRLATIKAHHKEIGEIYIK